MRNTNEATGSVDRLSAELLPTLELELESLELPVLPDSAARLISAANDPNWDVKSVCDLVRRDPSLTARLIKLANSPLYDLGSKIESVQQGIARLGIEVVRTLAVMVGTTRVFHVPGFETEVGESFEQSLMAAAFSDEIARRCRLNVERAFLCGLLHDVGRPSIIQSLMDTHQPYTHDELVEVAQTHRLVVAERLILSWGLPVEIAEAVIAVDGTDAATPLAETLRLAVACTKAVKAADNELFDALFQHVSADRLNLYRQDIDAVLQKAVEATEWVKGLV